MEKKHDELLAKLAPHSDVFSVFLRSHILMLQKKPQKSIEILFEFLLSNKTALPHLESFVLMLVKASQQFGLPLETPTALLCLCADQLSVEGKLLYT